MQFSEPRSTTYVMYLGWIFMHSKTLCYRLPGINTYNTRQLWQEYEGNKD
ncbi:hypothetical protein Lepto7375DRAFT_2948 [Leptolyngbya sp. PCC 7375]|nr:hypothetical protein Lepto7375DRAFT_2948 [Leptolyngbya sp. PCC 7375]